MANETFVGLTRRNQTYATQDTTVGNIGTGVDDLMSISIAAGLLTSNGDQLEVHAAGSYANNANNKEVKLLLGTTALVATGAAAQQNGDWQVRATIMRTAAATQRVIATHNTGASTGVTKITYTAGTEDFTTALTLKLTGEATTTDDITCKMLIVRIIPSAVAD